MNFVNKLLSVDAPPDSTLQAADLSLRGMFPLWAALLLLVLALAGTAYFYVREQAPLSGFRRGLLICLRTFVIAFVLLLLLRPVLVAEYRGERPQGVVLLLDNSQSMKLQDRRVSEVDRFRVALAKGAVPFNTTFDDFKAGKKKAGDFPARPERAELVRAILQNSDLKLLDGLKKHGPTRLYTFGQQLRRVADDVPDKAGQALLDAFTVGESQTGLADSINEILLAKDGDLPGAIVIMSDGRDNASKLPLDEVAVECARLKVPLYIYGVGSSEGGSLQFKDVLLPDTIFYEDNVTVPVRWRSRGLRQGTAVITLKMGDRVVAQKEVPVKEGEDFREVLGFTPQKRGTEREEKTDLTATIELKGNADYKDEFKKPLQVIDRKVKVLVVENTPRWEFKFLQPALLRDRRVEASFVLISGDPKLMQGGPPFLSTFPPRDKLFAFDLIILGDVPASYLDTERLNAIQDFVKEGGGLVMIAGRNHAPSGYVNTPLAEVLPVEFLPSKLAIDPDSRPQQFQPTLTSAGERSDMLALADTPEDNLKTWKTLPGWHWYYPVTKLRPGAVALLSHPQAKLGEQPMPLIATQYYGRGQVLFIGAEETWRWRANAQDKFFARFWGQVVYQLGLPHLLGSAKKAQVALEQSEAILGRPGYVHARLFDSDFRPLKDERITAELEFLDAKPGMEKTRQLVMEAVPGQPGEYRALLAHDSPGRFELKLGGQEPTTLPYRVSLPPRHEQEAVGLAEETLRDAAKTSGGKFYREEDLQRLTGEMESRKAVFTQRQEVLLWGPLAMLLFVAFITSEWVVRKLSNLS
jgi:hypothetical protein